MCPPEHFAVSYAINPWMEPDKPTDAANAMRQWTELRRSYLDLGHDVRTIEPVAGLPDMVFAANGATVVGGTVLGPLRIPEPRARPP
jgi:N-dimethylarginine dimethylaminohydrolase